MRNYNNTTEMNKTLREIHNTDIREVNYNSSLVTRCCEIYNERKLKDFSYEDLRIMISQKESVEYLIPIALDYLSITLTHEDESYPGALLDSVSKISDEYWNEYIDDKLRLIELIDGNLELMNRCKKRLL